MNLGFDRYTTQARILPIFISFMPIFLFLFDIFDFQTTELKIINSIILYCGVVFFGIQYVRDKGKKIEKKLYKEWGGSPTQLILQQTTTSISLKELEFLYAKLTKLTNIPYSTEHSNEIFTIWTKKVISMTRENSLVQEENINYGFRRNFYAIKWQALLLNACATIGLVFFHATFSFQHTNINNTLSYMLTMWLCLPLMTKVILVVNIFSMIMILCIVTKKWVKNIGDTYAQRLFDSI